MNLSEALALLDHTNDAHWTADNQPLMTALYELTGTEEFTRQDVIAAKPTFNRISVAAEAAAASVRQSVAQIAAPDVVHTTKDETPAYTNPGNEHGLSESAQERVKNVAVPVDDDEAPEVQTPEVATAEVAGLPDPDIKADMTGILFPLVPIEPVAAAPEPNIPAAPEPTIPAAPEPNIPAAPLVTTEVAGAAPIYEPHPMPVNPNQGKLDALNTELADATKDMRAKQAAATQATKDATAASAVVNGISRQIDLLTALDPHRQSRAIRLFLNQSNANRAARAGRMRAFTDKVGVDPFEAAKTLNAKSPLDQALSGRKNPVPLKRGA